jgi:hypothetical protein
MPENGVSGTGAGGGGDCAMAIVPMSVRAAAA